MFGLKQAKMGKMEVCEGRELDQNEVKSFSHQNYHHFLPMTLSPVSSSSVLSANGFSCTSSSEDGSSSEPSSFTPFGGEYDPSLFNLNQLHNVNSAAPFSNSLLFGNSDEGSIESDLSDMFYDKMNIGVGKHNSNNSSVDFSHFNEKDTDEFGFVDCFSDGVSGYSVDNSCFDNGVYDFGGFYSSMLQQCGLDSLPLTGQDFDDNFSVQGTNLKYIVNNGPNNRSKSRKKKEKRAKQDIGLSLEGFCENDLKSTHTLLSEVQGFIYLMAKDQCGCRFLQRIFDEGSIQDAETIFIEIIDHIVELMTDQFGNYFVQKLLDVCSEEQKMQIVAMVTEKPGVLICLCLNTHGTRSVQKLIEKLNTRQQISLVINALEPGFLDLIKDVNGNHVVQRCLQCLDKDQNKFIFSAAAKFCVEIATHQHGCCVLTRCIAHATGKDRENLVTEISANGFHLAQDSFGNYVVQYIIEQKIPPGVATLLSQFEGNYVYMSMQKFSSHVVEKCLKNLEQSRSRIIHEFLSVPHFDKLLQDPFANYVVQSALQVTKGSLHAALVEAVEPYLILRTSPYCKKIFSRNLFKK